MAEQPPLKRVRKGTKSCVECRHRKVRCVWDSDQADACQNCLARGRKCADQTQMMTTPETISLRSRDRISRLENTVDSLFKLVKSLEARIDSGSDPSAEPAIARSSDPNAIGPIIKESEEVSLEDRRADSLSNSDLSDVSPSNPPSHLLQLFDNSWLAHHGTNPLPIASTMRPGPQPRPKNVAALRALLPTRSDMLVISACASSWLQMYNGLFPMMNVTQTGAEMLTTFDMIVRTPSADVTEISALLLSIAMTVQQASQQVLCSILGSTGDAAAYIQKISDTVNNVVISDDAVISTCKGIETALLLLRLDLGFAKVRRMWILLHRVIAVAEIMGLPQAAMSGVHDQDKSSSSESSTERNSSASRDKEGKAILWVSICSVNRLMSMTWSLPINTSKYSIPAKEVIDNEGRVISQAYLWSMADNADRILQLDINRFTEEAPLTAFNAAIEIDQHLRTLAAKTPKSWWKVDWEELSVDAILQFWHCYLMARAHMPFALANDAQQYAFSYTTCLGACQELVRRYICLRKLLPPGFCANHVIDLQAFTAAVFLLLATHGNFAGTVSTAPSDIEGLVSEIIQLMETLVTGLSWTFAHPAASALRSLKSLLEDPSSQSSMRVSLSLPLVGKIFVSRKGTGAAKPPHRLQQQHTAAHSQLQTILSEQPDTQDFASANMTNELAYSFETLDEHSFFNDAIFDQEPWLNWEHSPMAT